MAKVPLEFNGSEIKLTPEEQEEIEVYFEIEIEPRYIPGCPYYFEVQKNPDLWSIQFPILGLRLFHSPLDESSTVTLLSEDIEDNTHNFKLHAKFGYSLGNFHEFFVLKTEIPDWRSFLIGNVEISLGEVTPLATYIYCDDYNSKYHGEASWDNISSLRVFGVELEELEVCLLNALIHIQLSTGFDIKFYHLDSREWDGFWHRKNHTNNISDQLQPYKDLESSQLYYLGITTGDNLSACLYFYRVLEFYSFIRKHSQIDSLRRDVLLSSRDFLIEIGKLLTINERADICALASRLASQSILTQAQKAGLIRLPEAGMLGNELYDFRNSIVHAKYEYRSSIATESILKPLTKAALWREILDQLALEALNTFGR